MTEAHLQSIMEDGDPGMEEARVCGTKTHSQRGRGGKGRRGLARQTTTGVGDECERLCCVVFHKATSSRSRPDRSQMSEQLGERQEEAQRLLEHSSSGLGGGSHRLRSPRPQTPARSLCCSTAEPWPTVPAPLPRFCPCGRGRPEGSTKGPKDPETREAALLLSALAVAE